LRQGTYEEDLAACRRHLAGKRVVAFSMVQPIDWILDTMLDCQMEVVFCGITARRENIPFASRYWDTLPTEFCFHPERRREVLDTLKPDAVLVGMDNELAKDFVILDTAGVDENDVGFAAGAKAARRWARLLSARVQERWRQDFVPRDLRLHAMAGPLMMKVPT
jgi:hypothetical protein